MLQLTIPPPTQPDRRDGYWALDDADKILSWDYVDKRMSQARNYWIATINPNGKPHTVPVWGVWVDNFLYCGGGSSTRWFRNLERHPHVAIHLDNSDQAVILNGAMQIITESNADSVPMECIQDAYEAKYEMRHPLPLWQLTLQKVIAWTSMQTATRWQFSNDS